VNLVVAIDTVLRTDAPLRRPLIVAEPDALTIAEMISSLRRGLGRRPGLFPVPVPLLRYVLGRFGRVEEYERIAGSLIASAASLNSARLDPVCRNPGWARCLGAECENRKSDPPFRVVLQLHLRQDLDSDVIREAHYTTARATVV